LDRKISQIIGKIETSKEVEKIKHDLSMYESTFYDGESRRIKISRADLLDDEIDSYLEEIQDFILRSDSKIIELVGGNTRSFAIQALVNSFGSGISIRRGLTSDETTALGAAIYGATSYLADRNRQYMRFERYARDDNSITVRSPWASNSNSNNNDGANGIGGYYQQKFDFTTTRLDLSKGSDGDSMKMAKAIKASKFSNLLRCDDLEIQIGVEGDEDRKFPDFAADLFVRLDMLDLPEVMGVTRPGISLKYPHSLDYGNDMSARAGYSASDMQVEFELRHYQELYERIGSLYNQMEAFYFDRDGYSTKKESITVEIERIKTAYAYTQSSVDRMVAEYKNLLDTYEFCRIVTIDPDLMIEPMYAADPEVVIDPRLTRDKVDSIIRDEKGLEMLETMMNNV
jgi:Hsp70 protein